jgi:hypothetical protein
MQVIEGRIFFSLAFLQKSSKHLSGDQPEDPQRFGLAVALLDGAGLGQARVGSVVVGQLGRGPCRTCNAVQVRLLDAESFELSQSETLIERQLVQINTVI